MSSNKKYSYIIIFIIFLIMILLFVPFGNKISIGKKVGIIKIDMPITSSGKIIKDINNFMDRSDILGIILRLDTPGGGVAASQEIYEKVRQISESNKKPIIVSMGGVAASGGYYIALGADTIIANPGTATGSIGVIMSYPAIYELMDKVGVKYETIKSAKLKDSGSPFKDLSDEERIYFQLLVDDLHDQFVEVLSRERNFTIDYATELANGKVYSGRQALNYGLIDMIGTLEDALNIVARNSRYKGKVKIAYPTEEKKGLLDLLFGDIFKGSSLDNLNIYPKPEYRMIYK